MVYFKLLLNDKRQKVDNIYPIVVRVTFNKSNTTLTTGIRINTESWDANSQKIKHSHPNAQSFNKTVIDYYSKVQNIALQLVNENNFSFEALNERLNSNRQPQKHNKGLGFKEFAQQLIDAMLAINKAGNAIIYKTATNKLMGYANNPKLKFTEINYSFLEGFKP